MQRAQITGSFIFAALVLAGCAQGPETGAQADTRRVEDTGRSTDEAVDLIRYECEDGSTVQAIYPRIDTAEIEYDGQVIEMQIAVAASGSRYVGDGWEWWTKGMTEGTLTPLQPGEEIASADGVFCTAE